MIACVDSPVGRLTLTERDGAITALEWRDEDAPPNTDLMKRFQLNTKLISIAKDLDESSASLLRMPNG